MEIDSTLLCWETFVVVVIVNLVGYVFYLRGCCVSLEQRLGKEVRNRADERVGRTRAEKKLRNILQVQYPLGSPSFSEPVAVVRSCYPDRRGTPRQGGLVCKARAYLQMSASVHPNLSLQGLEDFSHLWIIFVFHENTNLSKLIKKNSSVFTGVKPKVVPPRLNEEVGVFSTRSPHRYNPIGLSLVRIESIDLDNGRIYVQGIDLLNDTPILDIKPYIARYDSVAFAASPDWINETTQMTVKMTEEIRKTIISVFRPSEYFVDQQAFVQTIEDILAQDIRSQHQKTATNTNVYEFHLDNMKLSYSIDKDIVQVLSCTTLSEQ